MMAPTLLRPPPRVVAASNVRPAAAARHAAARCHVSRQQHQQQAHTTAARCHVSRQQHQQQAHTTATTAAAAAAAATDRAPPPQLRRLLELPLPALMVEAAALRDEGHRAVTFSPKVFLPLTRLCRDACAYCTFAQPPVPGRRAFMTLDEVLAVARLGAAQGCTEALFTLGDKPELAYPEAAAELRAMGYASTLEYVAAAAGAVLEQTGLLPHINAGVMEQADLERLKHVSASQGLMLEGTAPALTAPGGAHASGCPDKDPAVRLAVLEAAGRARVPFTTGLLIGLGESRQERLADLLTIRDVHQRHGHIQEVIIQNFRAKPNTGMAQHLEPSLEELLWTVAAARIILGPHVNLQSPPNLTPAAAGDSDSSDAWRALLDAGINDWGGISPVTKDWVNPEKSWPHLEPLAAATAVAGKLLLPRLPVYPAFAHDLSHVAGSSSSSSGSSSRGSGLAPWLSQQGGRSSVAAAVHRLSDADGLVRAHAWVAGKPAELLDEEQHQAGQQQLAEQMQQVHELVVPPGGSAQVQQQQQHPAVPAPRLRASKLWRIALSDLGTLEGMPQPQAVSPQIQRLLDRVATAAGLGQQQQQSHSANASASRMAWTESEVAALLSARGVDMAAVVAAADALRAAVCGDSVSYVVNRNINYTNVCTYTCRFCAFSKGKASEALRGAPYLLPLAEITRRTAEAWARGATEVCLQGGIHPDFTGATYLDILAAAKAGAPGIHVHAFSPLEVTHGAATLGVSLAEFLTRLKAAGLGSLPGTAAEVLDADVRAALCPDKLSAQEWLHVVETAHSVGLRTTSTIMFGHLDSPGSWARHLLQLRDLQARTGGITEFVPLPFVHFEAPVYLAGAARRGPTLRECVLMHAVSRLVLWPLVSNIQASWVKMGPEAAGSLLAAGCNDMGGSIMNESITRAAGASHGQELPPARMQAIITAAGRQPRQRTTLYSSAPAAQTAVSLSEAGVAPLAAV